MDHDCGLCSDGSFYVGEGDTAPCPFCEESTTDMRPVLLLLYEISKTGHLSAYGMKHDVEDILGRYVPTEELVQAGQVAFVTRSKGGDPVFHRHSDNGGRTIGFYVKERFPLTWLWNKVTTKPRGARKDHWEAYQAVLAEKRRRASPVAPPVEAPLCA